MFLRRRPFAPEKEWTVDIGALMLSFEGLGDNCEFGLLQRRCGADPQGLLRLSHTRLATLEALLANECEGVMDGDDLALAPHPHFPEKIIGRSNSLDDLDHQVTTQTPGIVTPADHATNARRIAYLKRRFLEDLREGTKIFVRRGRDSRPDTVESFLARFRRLSQAWVLLVVETDDEGCRGRTVQLGHRYLVGYVGRLAITGDVLDSEVETWISVLLHAYGIVHGGRRSSAAPKLQRNAALSLPMLEQLQGCTMRRLHDPSRGDAVVSVELSHDMTFDESTYALEFADFPSDLRSFVCAIWIVVPTSFAGTFVRVMTSTATEQIDRQADLRKRDVWQRIWVLGHIRRGSTRIRVDLRTDAPRGTVFRLARPVIEGGTYPNPQEAPDTPINHFAL